MRHNHQHTVTVLVTAHEYTVTVSVTITMTMTMTMTVTVIVTSYLVCYDPLAAPAPLRGACPPVARVPVNQFIRISVKPSA